jgi:hypothetical protein
MNDTVISFLFLAALIIMVGQYFLITNLESKLKDLRDSTQNSLNELFNRVEDIRNRRRF